MQTAVSIPDPIFVLAERMAEERGISRSEFYANALAAYAAKCGEAPDAALVSARVDDDPPRRRTLTRREAHAQLDERCW